MPTLRSTVGVATSKVEIVRWSFVVSDEHNLRIGLEKLSGMLGDAKDSIY